MTNRLPRWRPEHQGTEDPSLTGCRPGHEQCTPWISLGCECPPLAETLRQWILWCRWIGTDCPSPCTLCSILKSLHFDDLVKEARSTQILYQQCTKTGLFHILHFNSLQFFKRSLPFLKFSIFPTIHDIRRDSDPIALTLTSVGGPDGFSSSNLMMRLPLALPYPIELFASIRTSYT